MSSRKQQSFTPPGIRPKIIKQKVMHSTCGCTTARGKTKTAYATRKIALAAAHVAMNGRAAGHDLQVYKCPNGGHVFHVGHPPRSQEPGQGQAPGALR